MWSDRLRFRRLHRPRRPRSLAALKRLSRSEEMLSLIARNAIQDALALLSPKRVSTFMARKGLASQRQIWHAVRAE
jgi:hypothetical protein